MTLAVLLSLVLLAGILTILGESKERHTVYQFLRILTMVLIIGIALLGAQGSGRRYRIPIVVGLLFSLAGDFFMMQRRKRFAAGLFVFLIAQIFYAGAFLSGLTLQFSSRPFIPLLIYVLLFIWILYPRLGKMKLPVMIYILVIISMVRLAIERHFQLHDTAAFLALVGAILFAFSDSVLALNRFVRPFRAAQAIILSTYFLAQCLIALSV